MHSFANISPGRMAESHAEEIDPAALQALLLRHRTHLANTHKEVHALKTFIKTLEGTNEGLRHEVSALKLELSHYKENELRLLGDLAEAEHAIEKLTGTIHKLNQDHAVTIGDLESQSRQQMVEHKLQFERVCAQLEATQQPVGEAQPLPWKRIANVADHPVHILREVMLEDQRREERILQRNLPIITGDNSQSGTDTLSRLLGGESESASSGHDTATWWVVLKRVHQVLKERRSILGIPGHESAGDFFIRSRNAMVGEWVQLHREINRGVKVVSTLKQGVGGDGNKAAALYLERQLDLVGSILGDVDTQCHRVKQSCFTDIDRILYSVDIPRR